MLNISGTELRAASERRPRHSRLVHLSRRLCRNCAAAFRHAAKQGVTIFFTGLSGSGKSTIANVLLTKFLEVGGRPVTLLDGDLVRKHLSSELGFSKEHRDINIRRIGYVASEITKNGGIAICAPIAPYDATRKHVRQMIEPYGGFILVHIATSVEVCEQRDRKGLYAKARAGILKEFTGISDPYEVPADAEVTINTGELSPEEAAQEIILHLERRGFHRSERSRSVGRSDKMELVTLKILVGFVVGVLIGMSGVGGGVLLLPVLIFGLRVPAIVAVGSDALFNFFTKIPASLMHLKKGTVRRNVVIALAMGSVPGSIIGVNLLMHIRHLYGDGVNNFIKSAVGVLLIVIPTLMLFQRRIEERIANRPPTMKGLRRHGRDRPSGRFSGRHDFGRIGQHHHDAVTAVLQFSAKN